MKLKREGTVGKGKLGEEIACEYLVSKRFKIITRNYWRKWGEIDIVAEKEGVLRFVEVKSVSRENLNDVSRETFDGYRPEDNVHPWKLRRLSRVIQSYLAENKVSDETEWQFDILAILVFEKEKKAKVVFTEDVIL